MSTQVFLSFAVEDQVLADQVAQTLRRDGLAISSAEEVLPGVEWAGFIKDKLEGSDGMVLIVSTASIGSSLAMMELGVAKALEKRVVAIRSGDAPSEFDGLDLQTLDASRMSMDEIAHTIQVELAS